MRYDRVTRVAKVVGFPECPRWRDGEIWFLLNNRIVVADLRGGIREFAEMPGPVVLGLTFSSDGTVISGDASARKIYRFGSGGAGMVMTDLSAQVGDLTNEVVEMPDGGMYVGSVGFDLLHGQSPRSTRLIRVAPGGATTRVGPEMLMPNGMVLADGGRSLYVAETFGSKISILGLQPDGDLVTDRTMDLADRPASHPDGIAVAKDGSVFYADPMAGVVVHLDPTGQELGQIDTGFPHPTSCVVGGEDEGTLFITATAVMAGSPGDRDQQSAVVSVDLDG